MLRRWPFGVSRAEGAAVDRVAGSGAAAPSVGAATTGAASPAPPRPPAHGHIIQPIGPGHMAAIRDSLFQALFFRFAIGYARVMSPTTRRMLEFFLLVQAAFMFALLVFMHAAYLRQPLTCLEHLAGKWPVDGVLRVEILKGYRHGDISYTLMNSYKKEYGKAFNVMLPHLINDYDRPKFSVNDIDEKLVVALDWHDRQHIAVSSSRCHNMSLLEQMEMSRIATLTGDLDPYYVLQDAEWDDPSLLDFATLLIPDERYIVEYAVEYGLLKISPLMRQKLNVTVHFEVLDPLADECFGGDLRRFLLEEFVGYDDVLISSVKHMLEMNNSSETRGYIRNVISGDHYRFVKSWISRSSYLAAALIMFLFTLSISMLLRYSHHQIFMFIMDLLQVLELNMVIAFPAAPLLTVILALIGMETIMGEFFNDTTVAFYLILTVWMADQFDAICCHTAITKRNWWKFFYLYHFGFYAYHYRFNGHNSSLALVTSWFFIQHSMVYFFHHYELPAVLREHNRLMGVANGSAAEQTRPPAPQSPPPPQSPPAAAPQAGLPEQEQPQRRGSFAGQPPHTGSSLAESSPTGSAQTGSSLTGSFTTGSSLTGSFTTGSSLTGSFTTGSSLTGSFTTGSSPMGSLPPVEALPSERAGQRHSTGPACPPADSSQRNCPATN